MKNIRETRGVPFVALLSVEDKAKIQGDEIPADLTQIGDALGVKKASDIIDFTASVGSIVFDIYDAMTEKPKAPLALERENQKRLDLAKKLDEEELELSDDVKGKVEKALEDDKLWSDLKISVSFDLADEKRYLQLSSAALDIFPDCKQSLVKMFVA